MSPIANSSNFLSVEVGLAMYNSSMLVETQYDDFYGYMMKCRAKYRHNYSDDRRCNTCASVDKYDVTNAILSLGALLQGLESSTCRW